jgi:hypothetical protein
VQRLGVVLEMTLHLGEAARPQFTLLGFQIAIDQGTEGVRRLGPAKLALVLRVAAVHHALVEPARNR